MLHEYFGMENAKMSIDKLTCTQKKRRRKIPAIFAFELNSLNIAKILKFNKNNPTANKSFKFLMSHVLIFETCSYLFLQFNVDFTLA